jgi:23S rRNA pseudouridine2605 synthase
MSKLGLGSRTEAAAWVRAGRVCVNGRIVHDPEFPVYQGTDVIALDGAQTAASTRRVIMLNKPRGLVTTTADEKGRETVYRCFEGGGLPWLAPVGRLDKASEGLLLFTNDPVWAAGVTDPAASISKTYHVQISRLPDAALLAAIERGVTTGGERLAVTTVRCLRSGAKHAWLEIILDEGRNRHIRRMLAVLDVSVLRLVRVALGSLSLGDLPKGQWRELSPDEIAQI